VAHYSSGWSIPVLIENNNDGDSKNPSIAISSNGNAIVSWELGNVDYVNIYACRFDVSGGWQSPDLLQNIPQNLNIPSYTKVALNQNDKGVVGWTTIDNQSLVENVDAVIKK